MSRRMFQRRSARIARLNCNKLRPAQMAGRPRKVDTKMNLGSLSRSASGLIAVVLLAVLALLAGCGGGHGAATRTISDAQRTAAINAVTTLFEGMPHTDRDAENHQLAAFMAARPEFEASGVSDDLCAWGRFTDGRVFIVCNNRPTDPGKQVKMPQPARGTRAAGTDLPLLPVVHVYDAMGTSFLHIAAPLGGLLKNYGYQAPGNVAFSGTVEELKLVQGDGIFYMAGHGGSGELRSGGKSFFALWTSTFATQSLDKAYKDDLNSNKLCYMAALGDGHIENHYAITAQFVSQYMHFGRNSLLYLTACSGDNAGFKAACITAGAGLYVGWSHPVWDLNAFTASLFFFDRMVGEGVVMPTDNPKKPPLDWGELQSAMSTTISPDTGLPFDTSPGVIPKPNAKLMFTAGSGSLGVIVPSIRDAMVDTAKNEVTLTGVFGSNQGSLEINAAAGAPGAGPTAGTAVSVKSWTATQVVASLPAGVDAATILVRVDGRASNVFKLLFVKLMPKDATVAAGSTTSIMAVVANSTGLSITYTWSITGGGGHLEDTKGHVGNDFVSTDSTVTYRAKDNATVGSTDGISVKATVIDGNKHTDIGTVFGTVTIGGGDYSLNDSAGGPFGVDDNLGLWLNGVTLFYDVRGAYSGYRGPFHFAAKSGDKIRIQVQDWYGIHAGIGPVYLTTPAGVTTLLQPAIDQQTPQGNKMIVLDQEYTLP